MKFRFWMDHCLYYRKIIQKYKSIFHWVAHLGLQLFRFLIHPDHPTPVPGFILPILPAPDWGFIFFPPQISKRNPTPIHSLNNWKERS